MGDLEARAAELRAADAAASAGLPDWERAAAEQLELSRGHIARFIGRLAGRVETTSLYAEVYRKGGAQHGDRTSERTITGYDDVQTGYLRVGGGWVVQDYKHNDGDLVDGIFVLENGKFTRRVRKIEQVPRGRLNNVPTPPFYDAGLHIMEAQVGQPLPMDELFPETAEFARQENADLLTRALMHRYHVL